MGDNFLKRQVRTFKKRRDRAVDTFGRPPLFNHPELIRVTYPVHEVNGYKICLGDKLLAVTSRVPSRIDLALGTKHVGYMEGEASESLRAVLSAKDGCCGVYVSVISKCDLSGVANVQIVKEDKAP